MELGKGVISRILIKDQPVDQYGKDKRKAFQLEGDDKWYSCGSGKGDTLQAKSGKDYIPLAEGDSIEFTYEITERNGNSYYNTASSKIKKVTATVASASKPAQTQVPAAKVQATKVTSETVKEAVVTGGDYASVKPVNAGIRSGMALNNAVNIYCAGKIRFDDIYATAGKILEIAEKLEAAVNNGLVYIGSGKASQVEEGIHEAPPTPVEKPAAKAPVAKAPTPAKPAPTLPPEPTKLGGTIADFDDDLPF